MTPEEKAKELFNKFRGIKPLKLSDYSVIYYPTAKLCALITVDEILKSDLRQSPYQTQAPLKYWQEVKQEIEKL